MKDLKEKTIRGGVARMCAQAANFALRLGSLMILARLLGPKDFGLVGMVTVFTGVLMLFRDFGLSSAAIQRTTVTEEQSSTLFWINVLTGIVLACTAFGLAPAVARFYHEPRLVGLTIVLALGFLFNAAGVQHSVLLQRQMRFTALSIINTVGLLVATAVGVGGANAGYGYWALAAMTVTAPLVSTAGFWLATRWVPGMPRRRSGIRSMMHFGSALTLNSLIIYAASNAEKILLGRVWGVDALGIYGRAYQLINIPTDNLNSAAGEVAFSALSRIQDDPPRLRRYFLKGYSLILAMSIPVTATCGVFAKDVILAILGPKWISAVPIFRILAPTILVFAIANPLGWLVCSLGMVGRSLKMAVVIAPIMVASYFVGLPYGPQGVASAYSIVMLLWLFPVIAWSVKGTAISFLDVVLAASRPLIASAAGAALAYGVSLSYIRYLSTPLRLVIEVAVLLVTFAGILLFVTGQRDLYLDLFRSLINRPAAEEQEVASA